MKIRLLPTTFDRNGCAAQLQHLSCFVIDDSVALDAGSLATATDDFQKNKIRSVVLTHAHLDHIAGLPLFIDDLFAELEAPIRVHAAPSVIETLERDIFNWAIYPRFSELKNKNGSVLIYEPFECGQKFSVAHLSFRAVEVNHQVSAAGFIVGDERSRIAFGGDTAETDNFWLAVNKEKTLDALFIECAFPNQLSELAASAHHLTPKILQKELSKFNHRNCPIYVINLKPTYRERIITELNQLQIKNLEVMRIGETYEF